MNMVRCCFAYMSLQKRLRVASKNITVKTADTTISGRLTIDGMSFNKILPRFHRFDS